MAITASPTEDAESDDFVLSVRESLGSGSDAGLDPFLTHWQVPREDPVPLPQQQDDPPLPQQLPRCDDAEETFLQQECPPRGPLVASWAA